MSEVPGYTGYCLCKAINLTVPQTVTPSLSFICHCRDCQRNAGGPYQVLSVFPTSAITTVTMVTEPQASLSALTIPGSETLSGKDKIKNFCSKCGCTISTVPMKWNGEMTVVRTALFDGGMERWKPSQEWFVGRRPEWVCKVEGAKEFEGVGGVGM